MFPEFVASSRDHPHPRLVVRRELLAGRVKGLKVAGLLGVAGYAARRAVARATTYQTPPFDAFKIALFVTLALST